jgi:hypothetical protein
LNKIGLEMVAFKVFIDGNAVEVAKLCDAQEAQNKKSLSQNENENSIL